MKNSIFILVFMLAMSCSAQKQVSNALQYPALVVNDLVAIDSTFFNGFGFAKQFYNQQVYKVQIVDNMKFIKFLVQKMTKSDVSIYKNYSPYKDVFVEKYNEVYEKIPLSELADNLGEYTDTIMQVAANGELEAKAAIHHADISELKALLFYDVWSFDEKNFSFTKKVIAYCPIRKYPNPHRDDDDWWFKKIGFIVTPVLKKRQENKIHKRMKLFAHVEYEFPLENKEQFGNNDNEMALYTEDLESPNWNSYARQKFRNLLINKALSQQTQVKDYASGNLLGLDKVKANLGYGEQEVIMVDPDTGEEKIFKIEPEIVKEEIKSVIFIEDWYYDPETLLIEKKVKGLAPVRFFEDPETGNTVKKIAFVLYL